jgi:hypothetical protein
MIREKIRGWKNGGGMGILWEDGRCTSFKNRGQFMVLGSARWKE